MCTSASEIVIEATTSPPPDQTHRSVPLRGRRSHKPLTGCRTPFPLSVFLLLGIVGKLSWHTGTGQLCSDWTDINTHLITDMWNQCPLLSSFSSSLLPSLRQAGDTDSSALYTCTGLCWALDFLKRPLSINVGELSACFCCTPLNAAAGRR